MINNRLRFLIPFFLAIALGIGPKAYHLTSSLASTPLAAEFGNSRSVVRYLSTILNIEPWRVELWEDLGYAAYQSGNGDQALLAFQQAKLYGTLSVQSTYALAQVYEQSGDTFSALESYRQCIRDGLESENIYQHILFLQRQTGDLPGVEDTLRSWLVYQPDNAGIYYSLGSIICLDNPSQARSYLEQAAAIDSSYVKNTSTIVKALYSASFQDDLAYQKVVIGRALGSTDQWDLALIAFEEAIQLNPSYGEAWAFHSEALQQNGENGYVSLQKALELTPDSVLVRSLAAVYWRRQGDPQKALEYLYANLEVEPDQAVWVLEIGNTIAEDGDIPLALTYLEQAANLDAQDPYYWRSLAVFCSQHQIEIYTIGFPAARRALILAPEDSLALDTMGWLLFVQGDEYSSERFLVHALQNDSNNPLIHYHLGLLYLQRTDNLKAYDHLVQVRLHSSPSSELGVLADRLIALYFSTGTIQ